MKTRRLQTWNRKIKENVKEWEAWKDWLTSRLERHRTRHLAALTTDSHAVQPRTRDVSSATQTSSTHIRETISMLQSSGVFSYFLQLILRDSDLERRGRHARISINTQQMKNASVSGWQEIKVLSRFKNVLDLPQLKHVFETAQLQHRGRRCCATKILNKNPISNCFTKT